MEQYYTHKTHDTFRLSNAWDKLNLSISQSILIHFFTSVHKFHIYPFI